jgi:hypothetical protein
MTDTSRATNLAALADSLDYLADMIQGSIMQVSFDHPSIHPAD